MLSLRFELSSEILFIKSFFPIIIFGLLLKKKVIFSYINRWFIRDTDDICFVQIVSYQFSNI